jgi:hypothetical protein
MIRVETAQPVRCGAAITDKRMQHRLGECERFSFMDRGGLHP